MPNSKDGGRSTAGAVLPATDRFEHARLSITSPPLQTCVSVGCEACRCEAAANVTEEPSSH